MQRDDLDYYDVEVINGMHIPMSFTPVNVKGDGTPYSCGNPGSKYPRTNLAPCNWEMKPPSNDYNYVVLGGKYCNADSECAGGEVCGISFNPGFTMLFRKTCGRRIGYWSADEICGVQRDYTGPFDCTALWDLYACVGSGAQSCY